MIINMIKLINSKLIFFLILILISNCGLSIPKTKSYEKEIRTIQETQNSVNKIDRNIGDPYNVNDLRGCPVLIEIGKWQKSKKGIWSRKQVWMSELINSSGESIDYPLTPEEMRGNLSKNITTLLI